MNKTLHVSGIVSAHYLEFYTVHSALVSFVQVFDDRFQAESGWNWLCLEKVISNFFFFRKSFRVWDNVEKYCTAWQATNDNIAQSHCMLDN